jgi:hypothetical protein
MKSALERTRPLNRYQVVPRWRDVQTRSPEREAKGVPAGAEDRLPDIYYLHGPDRTTPYAKTFHGLDKKFKRFSFGSFLAFEVAGDRDDV